jgi:hypothetical protein
MRRLGRGHFTGTLSAGDRAAGAAFERAFSTLYLFSANLARV